MLLGPGPGGSGEVPPKGPAKTGTAEMSIISKAMLTASNFFFMI